ncbi:putative ribonuclease H-like domain-containing protein [Tanacetum coccineum]
MYSFDMKNIVPKESLTCLVAKAILDGSMLWHRRLGHINIKNINKLVKDNLVRGLPSKCFENDQTCVVCLKGKQHRASFLMHKMYCLVVTDDYSRFTWVFFLTTKDETSEILKNFIKEIENLVDKKVKIIRSDNGTEFKNKVMDDFCREKGIKREYSVARTPQQNGVAERRNRTLIEAARTMLADSKLPTTFWAEAVSTACYVQNRVLVVKPHNKTPYELFRGFKPALSFMRPFGCHVTILNTLDSLGKFDGKSDEGFFVGYSLSSKAFRVYNTRTKRVEENLHIGFLENKPMIEGTGPKWLFDIEDYTSTQSISKEVGTLRYLSLVVPLTKVGDEAVHKKLGDRMERAATTASSLEAELGNVNAQTRFEITSKQSIDPPISRGYTLRSGEDSMKLIGINGILQLMECRQLQALVDKKKGYLTESSFIRKRSLLDDERRITPLFDTMMVQHVEEMGEDSDHPTDSTPIPIIDQQSSSSQPKKKQPSKKAQRQEAEVPQDEEEHEESVLDLKKAMDAQAKEIAALKKRIQRLERRKMSRPTGLKRLRKVSMSRRVESSKDQKSLGAPEDVSK